MDQNRFLTSLQAGALAAGCVLMPGLWSLPSALIGHAGRDSLWLALAALILPLAGVQAVARLYRRHPAESFRQLLADRFSPVVADILKALVYLCLALAVALCVAPFLAAIRLYLLPGTSTWLLCLVTLGCFAYACTRDTATLPGFWTLMLLISGAGVIMIFFPFSQGNYYLLLPWGEDLSAPLAALRPLAALPLPLLSLLVLYPHFQRPRRSRHSLRIGLLAGYGLLTVCIGIAIAVLGAPLTATLRFPGVEIVKTVAFFERLELFFMLLTALAVSVPLTACGLSARLLTGGRLIKLNCTGFFLIAALLAFWPHPLWEAVGQSVAAGAYLLMGIVFPLLLSTRRKEEMI